MKVFFVQHFLPILFSFTLVYLSFLCFNELRPQSLYDNVIISGTQQKTSTRHPNFELGDEAELDLMASILNKEQLTLFGSSEFSELPLVSYNFFPDSLGRQMLGIGHAYHQHLSILIELLATDDFNQQSEICILLSPGWFQNGGGTNTEAFIEFGRPNFLSVISQNPNIPSVYKKYLGKYIDRNHDAFSGSSESFDILREAYLKDNFLSSIFVKINTFIKNQLPLKNHKTLTYNPELAYIENKTWDGNFDELAKKCQSEFVNAINDNHIYVYDSYYNQHLVKEDGTERFSMLEPIDFNNNIEFKDFKMVVNYIKDKQMNASFVIIPFNPYYYKNTEVFNPLIDSITHILNSNEIPYLDLYVSDTLNYQPGTLKDVMHLGDYGWMRVNKFIDSLYYNE